jgi:hypothetical protein
MLFLTHFAQDSLNILWLGLGLFIAGVLEALLWQTKLFELLNVPIQSQWFGPNKRWRGLISLPLTCAFSTFLLQLLESQLFSPGMPPIQLSHFNYLEYGLLVGFIFNLSELPNSFIKRRLQIPAGDESSKIFYFIDHMDSTYGVLLLWFFYFHLPLHLIVTGAVVTPLLFMGATWVRRQLGLKA